ncbi:energy-coupling factor ABC transporter ATP-binding protein [Vibrio sp. SS-MA-C1-2]|uniref:ABC transporter ATP-binding protein n=1 Tax=Vibrio sp. SS-MA-C1-2 TaxID=2908646 RepID=UPI001F2E4942|nr:energy-coupling factor ABC transporter ATP-binding protein [Vibrio sp. SS-MA-C1-2]UJF18155.1 energy-coupling factor ABC transporter ATP-binding protein [Vibrio sp. SS-MA-C1-2]
MSKTHLVNLNAQDISKQFGQRLLFNIESLELQSGIATYLNGANGVGKTTLLKILAGIIKPTTGRVKGTLHQKWYQKYRSNTLQQQVIYMHQSPYLFDGTVLDNVRYGLKFTNMNKQQTYIMALNSLKLVHLESFANEHISVLSGGERQRVAMARAWVLKPSVLLMDEPSANLDEESIVGHVDLVKDLLNQGTSIIITSHQQNALTDLCKQHLILENKVLIQKPDLQIIKGKNYAYG